MDSTNASLDAPPSASALTPEQSLALYEGLLLPRMIEERMLTLLRQGTISKWFSGIGQEAISVGAAAALRDRDWILPLHRNLGVFTSRRFPLDRLFKQWQGMEDGYTQGRDRSFHFGAPEHRVVGMISHLGAMLGVADGIALASNIDGNDDLALVFSGDGGTSQGDFHEAVNVAAVWNLPVLFMIENNGYGLSTPTCDQYRCTHLADRALGYGIEGVTIDGNDVEEVYSTVTRLAERARRERKPAIIEAMTFRMRGHEEASGVAYVPKELFATWRERDPVATYEQRLRDRGLLDDETIASMRARLAAQIEEGVEAMRAAAEPVADRSHELGDVYAPSPTFGPEPDRESGEELRFVDAVSAGLREGMKRDPGLIIMGQDVAEYGGVFKVTEGFVDEFGRERVRNTPLCESAILGSGLGLAIAGHASTVEMQFADFVSTGFNQIVNNLAKTHYRWDQQVNVTVRMPTGAGVGAGPFHSQSTEAWFTHVPGLKVVYPATPFDAKGLLISSLADPNPVLFFEHKALYRSIRGMVPSEGYTIPFGSARVAHEGSDATIVTYGAGLHWTLAAVAETNRSIEVIDLRTLLPWDRETVFASVRKTGRCLVLHEDTLTGGFGGEIAASIGTECFRWLDAPVMRLGALDTPVPFTRSLERAFLPQSRLSGALSELLAY